jgi:5-enolpyruvylshikimate-3-phosphate synthase
MPLVSRGHYSSIDYFVSVGCCWVCQDGITALHLAAEQGRKEIVSLLLDSGADIEAMDEVGLLACSPDFSFIF